MCTLLAGLAAAFWISHQALKTVYDHEDGLTRAPHDITGVKEIIVNKYKVSMVPCTKSGTPKYVLLHIWCHVQNLGPPNMSCCIFPLYGSYESVLSVAFVCNFNHVCSLRTDLTSYLTCMRISRRQIWHFCARTLPAVSHCNTSKR